jgi:transcriptional regulator GlxA family with amidase domain
MTCGGGAASTDLLLSMIARDHGSDVAAMVSEMCLRTMVSGAGHAQRSSIAALMNSRNPLLVAVVNIMSDHIEDPLPIHDVAHVVGCSSRHLERLFRDATGKTPGAYYRGLRLDRGRSLLSSTDLPLIEVATACGFASVSHFSKAFRSQFGAAPTKLKQTITLASRPTSSSASNGQSNPKGSP